jgi:hypothetical protein
MAEPVKDAAAPAEEATRRDAAVPRVRRGFLWVLAGAAAAFVYAAQANWSLVAYPYMARVQARFQLWAQQRQFARQLRQDPPVGARLPDALISKRAASVREQGRKEMSAARLVVFGGPLSACCTRQSEGLAHRLAGRVQQKVAHQSVEVVLVLQASAAAVREYAANQQLSLAVVADEDGFLAKAYNAFWTPRVYGLREGRLSWIQKEQRVNEQQIVQSFLKSETVGRSSTSMTLNRHPKASK